MAGDGMDGCPNFFDKGPEPLSWAGSQAAGVMITISDMPNHVNYFFVFIWYIFI